MNSCSFSALSYAWNQAEKKFNSALCNSMLETKNKPDNLTKFNSDTDYIKCIKDKTWIWVSLTCNWYLTNFRVGLLTSE